MTLTLDVSRWNFDIALFPELLVWLMWNEKEVSWYDTGLYDLALWPHPWPWPWSFKVRVWNNFISGMGRPIDNELKGCESSIHDHDIDLCDHGWVGDVLNSDRGDFRRRRVVNISSLLTMLTYIPRVPTDPGKREKALNLTFCSRPWKSLEFRSRVVKINLWPGKLILLVLSHK